MQKKISGDVASSIFSAALMVAFTAYASVGLSRRAAAAQPAIQSSSPITFSLLPASDKCTALRHTIDPIHATVTCATLVELISLVYRFPPYEIVLPESDKTQRYDMTASSEQPLKQLDFLASLAPFLDRSLSMKHHIEKKAFHVLALTAPPNGIAWKVLDVPEDKTHLTVFPNATSAFISGVGSIADLAIGLNSILHSIGDDSAVVVDETGLASYYTISIKFCTGLDGGCENGFLPLSEALKYGPGIGMIKKNEDLDVFVVDSANRMPAGN